MITIAYTNCVALSTVVFLCWGTLWSVLGLGCGALWSPLNLDCGSVWADCAQSDTGDLLRRADLSRLKSCTDVDQPGYWTFGSGWCTITIFAPCYSIGIGRLSVRKHMSRYFYLRTRILCQWTTLFFVNVRLYGGFSPLLTCIITDLGISIVILLGSRH
jgi:hypothetical protein